MNQSQGLGEPFGLRVFVDTIGDHSRQQVQELCGDNTQLQCQHARQLKPEHSGETLSLLHSFCQDHPNFRVAFVHNKIDHGSVKNTDQLLHMTQAVTSPGCLAPEHGCNVCSLGYSGNKFTVQFTGNIFAADCSYIRRLHAPNVFEKKMTEVVTSVLLKIAKSKFTTRLVPKPKEMEVMGLDHHSIDHWVGSHPMVDPCQVSLPQETIGYWRDQKHKVTVYNFSQSRDPVFDATDFLNEEELDTLRQVLKDQSLRQREYSLLAGRLFQWYQLYGEAPSNSSWVWNWFPDGRIWKDGVAQYGSQVVDELTDGFSDFETTFFGSNNTNK
jgi:hypothetical protein